MKGIKRILSESGIALVTVLVLSAISLVIMAGLIYLVTVGTQISGIEKRYKTALEAASGGVDISLKVIAARGNNPFDSTVTGLLNFQRSIPNCLIEKMNKATANWSSVCPNLSSATSLIIDPSENNNPPLTYDVRFDIGTYRVYAKIVDTVEGNSGGDEGLIKGGVVESNPGEVAVMSIPYLYTIEILSQRIDNPSERAKLSVLYEY
ncbi:MAG: hypothetical protein N2257_01920 [Thermodesulfovibrionales bacterium]|nr:hypothetical protein [Thermodesulfovibrionales bacterium]